MKDDTVFIGNLAWTVTKETLAAFFSDCEGMTDVSLATYVDTGRLKGWGLVKFNSSDHAHTAIQKKNLTEHEGRVVHMRIERDRVDRETTFNIFVGNLPYKSLSDEDFDEIMAPYDPYHVRIMYRANGRQRGFAVCKFETEAAGLRAIKELNGRELNGRIIEVRWDMDVNNVAETSSVIYVTNFPPDMTKGKLLDLFQDPEIGPVELLKFRRSTVKKQSWALIKLEQPERLEKTIEMRNGYRYTGWPEECTLHVRANRKHEAKKIQ